MSSSPQASRRRTGLGACSSSEATAAIPARAASSGPLAVVGGEHFAGELVFPHELAGTLGGPMLLFPEPATEQVRRQGAVVLVDFGQDIEPALEILGVNR